MPRQGEATRVKSKKLRGIVGECPICHRVVFGKNQEVVDKAIETCKKFGEPQPKYKLGMIFAGAKGSENLTIELVSVRYHGNGHEHTIQYAIQRTWYDKNSRQERQQMGIMDEDEVRFSLDLMKCKVLRKGRR